MTRDIRNVLRGKCRGCTECESFISVSGLVLCDYCGCPPVQHEKTEENKLAAGAAALLSSEVEDEIDSDRHDGSNLSTSTKKSRQVCIFMAMVYRMSISFSLLKVQRSRGLQ